MELGAGDLGGREDSRSGDLLHLPVSDAADPRRIASSRVAAGEDEAALRNVAGRVERFLANGVPAGRSVARAGCSKEARRAKQSRMFKTSEVAPARLSSDQAGTAQRVRRGCYLGDIHGSRNGAGARSGEKHGEKRWSSAACRESPW